MQPCLFVKCLNNFITFHTKCIPGYVGMWSSSIEDDRLVKLGRRKDERMEGRKGRGDREMVL